MNLARSYLGMTLRTPLVPSASPLSENIDNVKRMEDAGAAALVLHSLFEEHATPQRSTLAKTLDVFGGVLGRHLRLALDHDADSLDYLGVGKRSDVANVHGIRDGA